MRTLIEFIFPLRLHRFPFFLRALATDVLAGTIYALSGTNSSSIWLVLLILALAAYQLFCIILPRIRDIGMNNWWLLLILVPGIDGVFGMFLLFRTPARFSERPNPALQATVAAPSC